MSKFDFTVYEKTDGDAHITRRLKDQHKEEQNQVSEGQLESGRYNVDESLTEKLLDGSRTTPANKVTEKNLSDSKGDFEISFRNDETYTGDINKLEEKRVASDPVEKEKYELANQLPEEKRWWEEKSPDGLKIAGTSKKKKPLIRKAAPVAQFDLDEEDFAGLSEVEVPDENISAAADSMTLVSDRYLPDGKGQTREIVFSYAVEELGDDEEYALDAAMEKINKSMPEVSQSIEQEDLEGPEFIDGRGRITLTIDQNDSSNGDDISFEEEDYNTDDSSGTTIVSGSLSFAPTTSMEQEQIVDKAVDFINGKHPEANISKESIDTGSIDEGIIRFVSSPGQQKSSCNFEVSYVTAQSQPVKKN